MAYRPVRHDHVIAKDAFEGGADTGKGGPRALVPGVRLEFDPDRAERLEGVRQLEELRFAIRASALERRRHPCPADLQAPMFRNDGQEAAAADRPARGPIDRRE